MSWAPSYIFCGATSAIRSESGTVGAHGWCPAAEPELESVTSSTAVGFELLLFSPCLCPAILS